MEARCTSKYIRVSAQKARLVIDQIRGKSVDEAMTILALSDKAVSKTVTKVLKSAVANAENTKDLDVDKLFVRKAFVNQGPTTKRMRPRAMGRGNTIKRKMSHITVVVDDGEVQEAEEK